MKVLVLFFAFVNLLCFGKINDPSIDTTKLRKAWKEIEKVWPKLYYDLEINGKHFAGYRPWERRWTILKDAFPYKGKRILELGSNLAMYSTFIKKYDHPEKVVAVDWHHAAVNGANLIQEAFGIKYPVYQLNFDKDDYESVLGYDFDLVIAFSIYKWVNEKKRFLNYLSKFNNVLYEGHDSDATEIHRFKKIGFNYHKIIGRKLLGPSYNKKDARTIILFSKKPL